MNKLINNFKKTDIGLIPFDWDVKKFGDVAEFKNGINFTSDQKGEIGILTIDVLNMYSNGFSVTFDNLYRVNKEIDKSYLLKSGDLLFVRSSLKREGVGWTALFTFNNEPTTYCGFIIRARILVNNFDRIFLTYYFRSENARSKLISSSAKLGITNINQGNLSNINIPLPPISEQQKIAHILSKIRQAIEVQEKITKTTQELKKALMQKLFTEGLNGEPQKQTEIGLIPESWEVKSVFDLFETQQGKQLSARTRNGINQKSFLRTSNVFWGSLDLSKLDEMNFTKAEEIKLKLEINDVLLCEGGEIGRCVVIDRELPNVYYQNHLHRLRRKNNSINPYYFAYWIYYSFILSLKYFGIGNVTTIPNLSSSRLNSMKIPVARIEEQNQIVSFLKSLDNKSLLEETRKNEIKDLFQVLLNQLMTGQIRAKDIEFEIEETLEKDTTKEGI